MDIVEARKKVQITNQERSSIENYIGFNHTQINALSNFEVKSYIEASKRGWYLLGMKNDKSAVEVGEEVLNNIQRIVDVYMVGLKYSSETRVPSKLYRGTSVKEAENLREGVICDKILSTTTNKNMAMSFGDAAKPAFLEITIPSEVPVIDVTEFIGEENLNRLENEYILPPFTKVKNANYKDKYGGYTYYTVELEKSEMRTFEEGEKENFKEVIKSDFVQVIGFGKELVNLYDEYEIIGRRIQYTSEREEREYLSTKRTEIMNRISEFDNKVKEFSDIMKKYIQGCCAEKEQEYLQAYEIVKADEKRILEEERKIRQEENRKKGISDFEKRNEKFGEDSKKISQVIYSQYKSLKSEEVKYYNIANTLGIKFDLFVSNNEIEPNLGQIAQNITGMKEKIGEISIDKDSDIDEIGKAFEIIVPYENALISTYRNAGNLSEIVSDYGNEAMLMTKKGIDEKVQNILKNTKLQLLTLKRNEVENRKIGFFGKLRGLDKLKSAELEGIALEMQLLKTTSIQNKSSYSIRETLADMRVFSIKELGSQMTEEMQNLEDNVKRIFGINESSIDEATVRKINAHPMIIRDHTKRESTADKIKKMDNRNEELRVEISKNQYNNYRKSNSTERYNSNNAINRFAEVIGNTAKITQLTDEKSSKIKYIEGTKIEDDWGIK